MSPRLLMMSACMAATCLGYAEEDRRAMRGWKLTVGTSVIGGVKSKMGVKSSGVVSRSDFMRSIGLPGTHVSGTGRAAAYAAGSGAANGGKRDFAGGAWYSPKDSASQKDGQWSWNWRLHDPTELDPDGNKGFIEYTYYSEETKTISLVTGSDRGETGDNREEWLPGIRVEAAYELYASEGKRPWGVDFAVAFAYYFQRNLWRAEGSAAQGTEEGSREEGAFQWWNDSHNEAQYILDYYGDTEFRGGMWGSGALNGPGAELANDAWQVRELAGETSSWTKQYSLEYGAEGDYREYGIEMLVRPWWDPWEWLRLFASLGIEISHREFEWSLTAAGGDGSSCYESGEAEDWVVYGLFGGGFALTWRDFLVSGEALWRFGANDLEVDGETVHGSVEPGSFGFRLSFGYTF